MSHSTCISSLAHTQQIIGTPSAFPTIQQPTPSHSSGKNTSPHWPSLKSCERIASDDSPSLPTSQLVLIHIALAITLFLATTDTHIVSTSLPTISASLPGSASLYPWVGVSYTLTQTAFQPLYGKLADILGRKPVLHACIFIFLVGSALCGAAQTMIWLVLARGVAGVGAGGVVSMVWVIMGEIVPARDRAKWSEALSTTWATSALVGPVLGGVFSERVSWRWGFYINIPVCAVCMAMLAHFLRLPLTGPEPNRHWKDAMKSFDYPGLFLLMSATTALLLGFTGASQAGWNNPRTIILLSLGGIMMLAAGLHETRTTKEALIPPRIFRTRTTAVILVASFFQTFAFTAGTFYLALYYQAISGVDALTAGLMMLPYSLGSALISVAGSRYIQYNEKYKHVILCGFGLATTGFGLMIMMDHRTSSVLQEIYPLIAGLGMGLLFRSPFTALEAAMPSRDRAGSTGNFFLVRFIGTCTGLSIAGAVFESRIQATMPQGILLDASSFDWRTLVKIEPLELREEVLGTVSAALSMIWVVCTPCLGISFLLCFLVKSYPISGTDDCSQRSTLTAVDSRSLDQEVRAKLELPEPIHTKSTSSFSSLRCCEKCPQPLAESISSAKTLASQNPA